MGGTIVMPPLCYHHCHIPVCDSRAAASRLLALGGRARRGTLESLPEALLPITAVACMDSWKLVVVGKKKLVVVGKKKLAVVGKKKLVVVGTSTSLGVSTR